MNSNPLQLIADNYIEVNKMMVREIELATAHPSLTGNYREEMWRKFFRSLIPLKFSLVHGAMIIDSDGGISNEVDITVIDEQYTPYIFQYNMLKLIPIEAVSMAIECKSKDLSKDKLEGITKWAESIEALQSKNTGIARMASGYCTGITNNTQSKTQPIKVLVSLKDSVKDSTLEKLKEDLGNHFDFIIQEQADVTDQQKMFQVLVKNEHKTLGWWGERLNKGIDCKNEQLGLKISSPNKWSEEQLQSVKDSNLIIKEETVITNTLGDLRIEGNPWLTLNLQLNQLLMLINNPMLFPHFAYATAFKKLQSEQSKPE